MPCLSKHNAPLPECIAWLYIQTMNEKREKNQRSVDLKSNSRSRMLKRRLQQRPLLLLTWESHVIWARHDTYCGHVDATHMKCTNVTRFTGDTRCKDFILATGSSGSISNPRRDHLTFTYIETFNWKAARQVKSATLPHRKSRTITFTVMFNTHWTLWVARKSSTSAHFQWDMSQLPHQLIPIRAPWKKKRKACNEMQMMGETQLGERHPNWQGKTVMKELSWQSWKDAFGEVSWDSSFLN